MYALGDELAFPDPDLAEDNGLLAVGGDLSPKRLLLAYSLGIFPWYEEGLPILWHSPDPRFVLVASELHIGRSLRKSMRKAPFEIRCDTAFTDVMRRCGDVPRPGQDGTWITRDMLTAYGTLHSLGFAHSIEAWRDDTLVGGLYGVSIGGAFFGESMFAQAQDASKIAFATLVQKLVDWGIELVDCQVYTDHLSRFGATQWSRRRFLESLGNALQAPTRRGPWDLAGE